jgi:hypothetical protein
MSGPLHDRVHHFMAVGRCGCRIFTQARVVLGASLGASQDVMGFSHALEDLRELALEFSQILTVVVVWVVIGDHREVGRLDLGSGGRAGDIQQLIVIELIQSFKQRANF